MNIDTRLRKLARNSYWQNLYRSAKVNINFQLFENSSLLSGPQSRLLYWLSVYDILFEELARCESDYLTESVIEDDDRCDAYLYYRKRKSEKEWKKYNREKNAPKTRSSKNKNSSAFNVDMRRS